MKLASCESPLLHGSAGLFVSRSQVACSVICAVVARVPLKVQLPPLDFVARTSCLRCPYSIGDTYEAANPWSAAKLS